MVRRQTRVQKRNRRQKTKRNNRRQNKTLRRKRQSRRKGGSSETNESIKKLAEKFETTNEFLTREVEALNLSKDLLEKYKQVKNIGEIYRGEAEKLNIPVKKYIYAIDEAKVFGKLIKEYINDKKNLRFFDTIDKKYLKDINRKRPNNKLKETDFERIKNEAKILGKTVSQYIDLENKALENTVDKLVMKELNITDEKQYKEMKEDAKNTGLSVYDINNAKAQGKTKAKYNYNIEVQQQIELYRKLGFLNNTEFLSFMHRATNDENSVIHLQRLYAVGLVR